MNVNGTIGPILIILIIFGSIFAGRFMRHRFKMFELSLQREREFSGDLQAKLDKIDDRLAALEKIVTDKGYQLKDEIEKL